MNVNNLEITMATFALNPIQFVSIPLVPTNVSNQNLTFNTVTGFVKFCPKITILKLNYYKKVFFSSSIYLPETF